MSPHRGRNARRKRRNRCKKRKKPSRSNPNWARQPSKEGHRRGSGGTRIFDPDMPEPGSEDHYWWVMDKAKAEAEAMTSFGKNSLPGGGSLLKRYRDRIKRSVSGDGSLHRLPVLALAAAVWRKSPFGGGKGTTPPAWFCNIYGTSRNIFLRCSNSGGRKTTRVLRWLIRVNWVLYCLSPCTSVHYFASPSAVDLMKHQDNGQRWFYPLRGLCRALRTALKRLIAL